MKYTARGLDRSCGIPSRSIADSRSPSCARKRPGTVTSGGRGWLGRFGGGCDYEFSVNGFGNFVVGAFADYDLMNVHANFEPADVALAGNEKESGAWYIG
ncbi:MAG: hypothetical protein WBE84_06620, partial [Xanthobacteraceae bacterium]